jgi:hemerythrin-like metal-binding protein
LKLIKWDNAYTLENDFIDNQHKEFVNILNSAVDCRKVCGNNAAISTSNIRILDYIQRHFDDEILYFVGLDIPHDLIDQHERSHRKLKSRFEKYLSMDYESNEAEFQALVYDLFGWFVDHIVKEDKSMMEHIPDKVINE